MEKNSKTSQKKEDHKDKTRNKQAQKKIQREKEQNTRNLGGWLSL